MNDEEIFYRGKYKHKKGCDCGTVNPITEWCGGSTVVIVGYECPKCKCRTQNVDFGEEYKTVSWG